MVYKNNDIRLELSRLARIMDPKMKLQGDVVFKCENVPTLDPINFETPESYLALPKWNTKRVGSISFDFRTSEPNGLILFTHGKPQDRRDTKGQKNNKVDFFAVELLDGGLYLLLDMGSGTIKVNATQTKVNDGSWRHVDIQRDGRSGKDRGGREDGAALSQRADFCWLMLLKFQNLADKCGGSAAWNHLLASVWTRQAQRTGCLWQQDFQAELITPRAIKRCPEQ